VLDILNITIKLLYSVVSHYIDKDRLEIMIQLQH